VKEGILQKFLASCVIYAHQNIKIFFCKRSFGNWVAVTVISENIYQDKYHFLHVYKNSICRYVGEELLYVRVRPYYRSE